MEDSVAAVICHNGKLLLCKRKPGGHIGEKWELPGGKVEPGETLESTLSRELKEELGLDFRAGKEICHGFFEHKGNKRRLTALEAVYQGEHVSMDNAPIELTDHTTIAWAAPDQVANYDLPDSDREIINEVVEWIRSL